MGTVDPNASYFQPSLGSITGFDSANLPTGNPNLAEVGWSADQIRAFLLNLNDLNFPTEDWTLRVDEFIQDHVTDFNNPHKVTLDQIVADFVSDVLGAVTAGTPPDLPPFFAFDAGTGLPLGDLFPATYSSSNYYRMTEGGQFVNPATETEIVGTDYITGEAGIALFGGSTNVVPSTWSAAGNVSSMDSTIAQANIPTITYPFPFYTVSETGNTGPFGIEIPVPETAGMTYTLSVFLLSTASLGSVIFSQPDDTTNSMTVNLTDGSYTLTGNAVAGDTFVYATGVIRISFSFTSDPTTPDNAVRLSHLNPGDTTPVRQGINGRPVFSIANPIACTQSINQPVLVDPTQPASATAFVLNLNKIPCPATMSALLVSVSVNAYPRLPAAIPPGASVLAFDALTITRDSTQFYVSVGGTVLFTSTTLPGLNNLTISYSPTQIIFKDLATPRQVVTPPEGTTFPPLSTAAVSSGPFGGYLKSIMLYAQADNNQCVEFLNNG